MDDPVVNKKNTMHEIGNALAVMSGHIDILADTDMSEEQEELIKKIYSALGLVKQIMENTQHTAPVAINTFLEDTISACTVFTSSKGISLNAVSEIGRLESGEFLVDEYKLSQILINLIKNAANHTDEGGITVSVKLAQSVLEFCVSDTGCGIPPEYIPHIFEPFVQTSSDKAGSGKSGSGMGLSICKSLVESMGGRIWAESKPCEGSKFHFTIPVARFKVDSMDALS